jgi:hypothetical protein
MARSPVRLLSCRGSSPAREPGRRDASPCGSSRGYGCFQAVAEPEPRCCRGGVRGDMRQVEYDSPEFWVGLHQVPAGTTDVDSQLGAAGVDDSGRFGSGDRGHSVKLGGEGLRFLWCGGIVIEEFRAKRGRGVVLSGPDRLQQLPLRQPVATRGQGQGEIPQRSGRVPAQGIEQRRGREVDIVAARDQANRHAGREVAGRSPPGQLTPTGRSVRQSPARPRSAPPATGQPLPARSG